MQLKKYSQAIILISYSLFTFFNGIATAETKAPTNSSDVSQIETLSIAENDPGLRVLLVAKEEAILSSRFFGTITRIWVKEGGAFRKGDKLVSFDCNELAADRAVAAATLKLQRRTNKANEELRAEKIVGKLENDLSRIRVEEARAKTKAYSTRMRNCSIVAPFSGQVVRLDANKHESLQPGTPIMLIQNPQKIAIELHVPSLWLQWLKSDTTFQTSIEETGKQYQAKVTHVGVRVDPVSQTIKIYASIEGEHKELLPGMSGYAEFDVPDTSPENP